MKTFLAVLSLVLVAVGAGVVWPYCAAWRLLSIQPDASAAEMQAKVDVPAVRRRLREDLSRVPLASLVLDDKSLDALADAYATPAGIRALLRHSPISREAIEHPAVLAHDERHGPRIVGVGYPMRMSAINIEMRGSDQGRRGPFVTIRLTLEGLRWKLTHIGLPPDSLAGLAMPPKSTLFAPTPPVPSPTSSTVPMMVAGTAGDIIRACYSRKDAHVYTSHALHMTLHLDAQGIVQSVGYSRDDDRLAATDPAFSHFMAVARASATNLQCSTLQSPAPGQPASLDLIFAP